MRTFCYDPLIRFIWAEVKEAAFWGSDEQRNEALLPIAPVMASAAISPEIRHRRLVMFADRYVRIFLPLMLRAYADSIPELEGVAFAMSLDGVSRPEPLLVKTIELCIDIDVATDLALALALLLYIKAAATSGWVDFYHRRALDIATHLDLALTISEVKARDEALKLIVDLCRVK